MKKTNEGFYVIENDTHAGKCIEEYKGLDKIILIEMDDRLIPILQEKFDQEIKSGKIEIIHNKYYNSEDIDTLTLPNKLEVKPIPDHHKVILPIEIKRHCV